MDVIARTFNPLWRARNGFKIKNLGDHKVLFIIDNQSNVDRILRSEPRSFGKHLVLMQRYEQETPIQELKFNEVSFWVQIYGIPLRYMTMEAAIKISEVIREVSCPTDSKEADGGNFLRVRAIIDLSFPLCRG